MPQKPLIITHSGHFQADDIFAVATLELLLGEIKLVRTRDPELIKTGDYVVDVGLVYDSKTNRFDHHQLGGAGERDTAVPYSSIGLVWKHFGSKVAGSEAAAELIDKKLIQSLDARDNGVDIHHKLSDVEPYLIDDMFHAFNTSVSEDPSLQDERFKYAVSIAKAILTREIVLAKDQLLANEAIEKAYTEASDKRIIVLEKPYSANEVLLKYPEPLYSIKPYPGTTNWKITCIRNDEHTFENRKPMPESWAGKSDEALTEATGVADAAFCHRGRWTAIAKSKEGAIALATIAANA